MGGPPAREEGCRQEGRREETWPPQGRCISSINSTPRKFIGDQESSSEKDSGSGEKDRGQEIRTAQGCGGREGTRAEDDQDPGHPVHGRADGGPAQADRGVLRSPDRDRHDPDPQNGEFTVLDLGKLVKAQRAARMGRDPATGKAIKIKAKTIVKFRLSKSAKDAVVPPKP